MEKSIVKEMLDMLPWSNSNSSNNKRIASTELANKQRLKSITVKMAARLKCLYISRIMIIVATKYTKKAAMDSHFNAISVIVIDCVRLNFLYDYLNDSIISL